MGEVMLPVFRGPKSFLGRPATEPTGSVRLVRTPCGRSGSQEGRPAEHWYLGLSVPSNKCCAVLSKLPLFGTRLMKAFIAGACGHCRLPRVLHNPGNSPGMGKGSALGRSWAPLRKLRTDSSAQPRRKASVVACVCAPKRSMSCALRGEASSAPHCNNDMREKPSDGPAPLSLPTPLTLQSESSSSSNFRTLQACALGHGQGMSLRGTRRVDIPQSYQTHAATRATW
mmetsp:Transcript_15578/g.42746  ORF Transcript_15578/g.42746 Transcript_15578/m.42746 type:complete len:227 (+) Transcript_15578:128-808(+)